MLNEIIRPTESTWLFNKWHPLESLNKLNAGVPIAGKSRWTRLEDVNYLK